MGVTIVAYLGFFVALAFALLGVAALALPPAADAIRTAMPVLAPVPGAVLGPTLLAFAVLLAATAWGMLRKHPWSWVAAVALVALSAAGDVARVVRRDANGLIGIGLVAILVAYLLRPEVRAWFHERA